MHRPRQDGARVGLVGNWAQLVFRPPTSAPVPERAVGVEHAWVCKASAGVRSIATGLSFALTKLLCLVTQIPQRDRIQKLYDSL